MHDPLFNIEVSQKVLQLFLSPMADFQLKFSHLYFLSLNLLFYKPIFYNEKGFLEKTWLNKWSKKKGYFHWKSAAIVKKRVELNLFCQTSMLNIGSVHLISESYCYECSITKDQIYHSLHKIFFLPKSQFYIMHNTVHKYWKLNSL